MKTFNTLTVNSTNDSFLQFIGYVNQDIDTLNRLITEYNAAPAPLNKEILVEIYYWHKDIVEIYPGDSLAKEAHVAQLLYEGMFSELQKEFSAHGLNTINDFSVSDFDRTSTLKLTHANALDMLSSMLNDNSDGYRYFLGEFDAPYKENIKNLLQKMAREDAPGTMHKELEQLKKTIRLDIAINNPSPERVKSLRNLLFAINIKLSYLEQKFPDDVVNTYIAPHTLPHMISGMSPSAATRLVLELSKGTVGDLKTLYDPADKEYDDFQKFLGAHSIEFLGGGNSKNFKVTEKMSGVEWVLKIENRLGVPRKLETKLAENALSGTLTPAYVSRPTVIPVNFEKQAANGDIVTKVRTVTRGIVVTEFCNGGDLESHGKKINDVKSCLSSAYTVYTQMAEVFEKVRTAGAAFPDAKNTNWLIDENKQLKIADGKSFLGAPNGTIDKQQRYYHLIRTKYMQPPEIHNEKINVDQMHAYMLGKNLYQYVSGCSDVYLASKHDGKKFDFSFDAFQTAAGNDLQRLIKKLVKNNPEDRMSVAEALKELRAIEAKEFHNMQDNCTHLYEQIIAIDPDVKTSGYQEKINEAEDIETLVKFEKELEEILNDSKAELRSLKKSCKEILDEITMLDPESDLDSGLYKRISALSNIHSATALTYELKRIECRFLAKQINEIDDRALNKALKAQIKALDTQQETTEINKLMSTLKKKRGSALGEQFILREACHELVVAMDQYKIKAVDPLMFEYRGQLDDQIYSTTSLAALTNFKAELERQVAIMDSSVTEHIKGVIAIYRKQSKSLFSSGNKSKANEIETALLSVPVELRDKIFSKEPEYRDREELVAVRVAMGKSGLAKAEKAISKEVDKEKASSSSRSLKERYTEFKDEELDEADNSQSRGKGKRN